MTKLTTDLMHAMDLIKAFDLQSGLDVHPRLVARLNAISGTISDSQFAKLLAECEREAQGVKEARDAEEAAIQLELFGREESRQAK